jgi:hypothetical protein
VKDSRKWRTLVFVDEWVTAVDEHGGFGKWQWFDGDLYYRYAPRWSC